MGNEVYTQAQRPMAVTTPLGPDVLLLVGFTGHEGISQLFNFQLELIIENKKLEKLSAASGGKDPVFDKLLGQRLTVSLLLAGAGKKKRFFNGICSRVSQAGRDPTFTHYRAELVPEFWLLTRRTQSRIFQRMTVKAILEKVLEDLDVKFELDEQGTLGHPRDYCVQYRESDFNFASRLMEEEGICYFFKHTDTGHKMVLANTNTPQTFPDLTDKAELNKVIYEEGSTGGRLRDEDRVYTWTKVQSLRSGKVTLRDHCFELPANSKPPFFQDLQAQASTPETVQAGQVTHKLKLTAEAVGSVDALEIYDYPGEYAQRFDGVSRSGGDQTKELELIASDKERTVKIRMQEEALAGLIIQGSSNCRHFTSGHKFTLERHFNANGVYVLTSVVHTAGDESYRSGTGAEFSYWNTFTCIPLGLPFRPPRATPKPLVPGTQTAVVVGSGAKDEEFFVDKYGRVKVQFHWDRAGPHNKDPEQGTFKLSTCWVRVAQPWAGKGWGTSFWPRIGQEVIVDFLEGDPDQPLIVGSVYNADQIPPYLGDAQKPSPDPKHKHNPRLSGVKTNTTPGGQGFNELRFDDTKDNQQIFVHAERDFDTRVKNDCRELVLHNRHLIVGSAKDGKKVGDQRELVFQDKHLHVKRNHVEHIEGNMLLLVGGGEGDAGNQDIVIKKTKKEQIDQDAHLHVKGNRSEQVGGTQSLTVGGDQHEKVGMNHALDAGMAIHLKAGMKVVIEAGVQLTIKAGANFIDISPAGIAISGTPMVLINSGGAAGTGDGANPSAPEPPKEAQPLKPDEADNAVSGKKSAP